jgi:hypothetical protein
VNAAKNIGVNINDQMLDELILKDPLKNMLEPMEPGSDIIRYRGNQAVNTAMSVDTARDIVNKNAKSAMKRGMNK